MRHALSSDRGSAAVEFALVLPILLTLVLGSIEFGRGYSANISVANAAREAARTMVVQGDATAARTAAVNAAAALPNPSAIVITGLAVCPPPSVVPTTETVTVTYQLTSLTGFFFPSVTLRGRGAMLCNN